MDRSRTIRTLTRGLAALAFVLVLGGVALACPTCKDQLAHDPASANIARGYAYSIVFMLSMPPLIFGSLCAYFYWEVRKARARQTLAA
jgi:Na+-driven multidrug efflux pump